PSPRDSIPSRRTAAGVSSYALFSPWRTRTPQRRRAAGSNPSAPASRPAGEVMNDIAPASAYGLWSLVIINSLVFIIFAFSFARPRSGRDWRSFGAFSAFILALFTEMYGAPLTIYLLSGWLSHRYPGVDLLAHDSGHLWGTLFGWRGDPHLNPLHL